MAHKECRMLLKQQLQTYINTYCVSVYGVELTHGIKSSFGVTLTPSFSTVFNQHQLI